MTSAEQVLTTLFVACSLVCWTNVKAIYKDKCIGGCRIAPTWVFLATNIYEVWYFAGLHQSLASLGAVSMVGANLAWIGLAYFYKWKNSNRAKTQFLLD